MRISYLRKREEQEGCSVLLTLSEVNLIIIIIIIIIIIAIESSLRRLLPTVHIVRKERRYMSRKFIFIKSSD